MERPTSLLSTIAPPLATGIAYAAGKAVAQGSTWGGLYLQSPFTYSALAGLLIAVTLRPIVGRVPWRRGTAFTLVFALFLALGPVALWSEARLIDALGVMGFPFSLTRDLLPELFGAWAAAGVLAWIYCARGGEIGFANLGLRFRRQPRRPLLARLAALAAVAALVSIALGIAGAGIARHTLLLPLFPANPWLRAALSGAEAVRDGGTALFGQGGLGWGDGAILLVLSWLRGLALALVLLPIALVVRGTRAQLALVFGILPFVMGEFAPLMENQPLPSQSWLTARVALSALGNAVTGIAAAWLIGQPPLDEERRPF